MMSLVLRLMKREATVTKKIFEQNMFILPVVLVYQILYLTFQEFHARINKLTTHSKAHKLLIDVPILDQIINGTNKKNNPFPNKLWR